MVLSAFQHLEFTGHFDLFRVLRLEHDNSITHDQSVGQKRRRTSQKTESHGESGPQIIFRHGFDLDCGNDFLGSGSQG